MKTTMKMMIAMGALTAGLTAMAPLANAAQINPVAHAERQIARNDELDGRIQHARDSLNRGWANHQLNRREYNRLSGRLNGIAAEKHRADRSGGIDRNELANLNAQLDQLHRDTSIVKFDNSAW
jgi:hypothetical protein